MALPPNLVIFNSNKKMVQLSKVVSNLKYTLDNCLFQISTFEDRYSKEFQDIFNNHMSIISKIITDISNHKDKIASENQKMYSEHYEKMKDQYNQSVESLTSSINLEQDKFLNEIENLKKEIPEIITKIDYLTSSITEPLSDIFSNATKETIPILKAKFQEELRLLDEESEKKFNALKDETTKKIESYELSFNKAKEDLIKEFAEISKDSEKIKGIINLKEKLQIINREILQLKETLLTLQNDFTNSIKDLKQKCLNEANDYQNLYSENNKQLSDINSQIESHEFDCTDEIKIITEKIQLFKEKHLEEITKLQSQLAQLLLDHKVEIENKKSLYQTNESLSDEQINNLKDQLQKEINQIKEENEKMYPPLIAINKNLQIQLEDLLNSFQDEKNKRSTQFQLLKEKNSKEIAKLKEEQDDELHLEYAKFESKMAVLVKQLGQNKSLISDTKIAEETKDDLTKQYNELKIKHEQNKEEFDRSYQLEKDELNNDNSISLKTLQEAEEKKFLEIKANLQGQIDQNIQNFEERKKKLLTSLKSEYENELSQIPKRFRDDKVFPNMVQNFQNEYKSLQKVLNDEKSEVPSHETNEKELAESIAEKEELTARIEKEKVTLQLRMKSSEEDEQKRHEFALSSLVPSHKEGEIDEFREKCKNRINGLIQRQDDLLFTLRKLKEQNTTQTVISASGFLEDEEIISLRKFLEELRNVLKKQRKDKQIDLEESVAKKNEEIELTIQKIEKDIEKAELSIENEKIENKCRVELVNKEAEIKLNEIHEKFGIEKESVKDRIEKVQRKIDEKIDNLKEILENERKSCKKIQNDMKIESEQNLINNHMKISETFEQLNKEINLLKNKREELENQSKIVIKTYEEICKKSMKKAENIPMRPQESAEIKRLEDILDKKTQHLTLVAKDLIGYKSRLKQQEDEYNKRFGVAPQVAVLNGENRRQSKSAAFVKKPLPPLKNSSVC